MRSVLINHFGDPAEVRRTVELPRPPDQVRFEIEAPAINPSDIIESTEGDRPHADRYRIAQSGA